MLHSLLLSSWTVIQTNVFDSFFCWTLELHHLCSSHGTLHLGSVAVSNMQASSMEFQQHVCSTGTWVNAWKVDRQTICRQNEHLSHSKNQWNLNNDNITAIWLLESDCNVWKHASSNKPICNQHLPATAQLLPSKDNTKWTNLMINKPNLQLRCADPSHQHWEQTVAPKNLKFCDATAWNT